MKDYDIANIAKDYRNQSVDACREMMIMWLQTVPSPTWGKLDDAISSLMNTLTTKPYGMLYIATYIQYNYTVVYISLRTLLPVCMKFIQLKVRIKWQV